MRGRQVLGRCIRDNVHKLCSWFFSGIHRVDFLFVMHGGLLLRYYRPYSRDWCMRGWLILGRVCICVCELRGRHLHSCVLVVIVHELLGW